MTSFEPVYTFLTKDGNKLKYKCNLCPGQKLISAQTTSNYGLTRHLKSSHSKEEQDQFEEVLKRSKSSGQTVTKKENKLQKFGFKNQTPDEFKKHQACSVSQKTINESVFQLIMGAALPLTFVRKPEFRNLVQTLQPGKTVMTYQSLRKEMVGHFSDMKQNMIECFSNVDYMCTTQDLWTAAKRSWLGMTVHWLEEDLSRASCGLACEEVKESATYDVLAKYIHDVHVDYKIQNKVNSAVK